MSAEVRALIRRMSAENPLWGAPRIHGELLKLGYDICESTIAKYMVRRPGSPTQTWQTFIRNHMAEIAAIDFFTVPTATFRTLYVFLVLSLDRRRIVHFNVTASPTAAWTSLQLIQAFPFDTAPRYLIRDRDGVYGQTVVDTLGALDIEQIVTAPRSPWQNGYCERVIGTIRRECLDHMIVLGEGHLRRVLKEYLAYYHGSRTHLGLGKDAPESRAIQTRDIGPMRRRAGPRWPASPLLSRRCLTPAGQNRPQSMGRSAWLLNPFGVRRDPGRIPVIIDARSCGNRRSCDVVLRSLGPNLARME